MTAGESAKAAACGREIAELRHMLNESGKSLQEKLRQGGDDRAKVEALSGQIAAAKARAETLRTSLANATRAVSALREQLATLEDEVAERETRGRELLQQNFIRLREFSFSGE